jgi:hypothetical protein
LLWGDEKEVLKVPKLDPIFIPLFEKQQVNFYGSVIPKRVFET